MGIETITAGLNLVDKGLSLANKIKNISSDIEKGLYSNDKTKFALAKLALHKEGIKIEDFLKEIESSFAPIHILDYTGKIKKTNNYNVYGQAYQHIIESGREIEDIKIDDEEWFFEWENNVYGQAYQHIIESWREIEDIKIDDEEWFFEWEKPALLLIQYLGDYRYLTVI